MAGPGVAGTGPGTRLHRDDTLGKVIPCGIYDLAQNTGSVNVGIDHGTPAFAVGSIARWWAQHGRADLRRRHRAPDHGDAGGSNSACSRA